MYDVFISLGYNCEVSFRIENYFGTIEAMPFSWSYILDQDRLIQALENIDMLFSGNVTLLPDNMIRCENYHIKFHPRYDILLHKGQTTQASINKAIDELRSRVGHLKQKFEALMQSNKNTLFIIKIDYQDEAAAIHFVNNIFDTLNHIYQTKKFTLVAVVEKRYLTDSLSYLESKRLKIRSVKKFAPKNHTDIMGDTYGWFKIFTEFHGKKNFLYFARLNRKRCHWLFSYLKKHICA